MACPIPYGGHKKYITTGRKSACATQGGHNYCKTSPLLIIVQRTCRGMSQRWKFWLSSANKAAAVYYWHSCQHDVDLPKLVSLCAYSVTGNCNAWAVIAVYVSHGKKSRVVLPPWLALCSISYRYVQHNFHLFHFHLLIKAKGHNGHLHRSKNY